MTSHPTRTEAGSNGCGSGSGRRALAREDGQTLAEYALILSLIAVALFGVLYFLQGQISGIFTDIATHIGL